MDPTPLPSAKSRDFLLRVGSRYVGVLALVLHIPTMLVVEPVYWTITVLPSAVIGTMDFLVARVLALFGALAAAVFFLGIASRGGRIVKTTGDGLLLEFPSVVNAVRCALEVQAAMVTPF